MVNVYAVNAIILNQMRRDGWWDYSLPEPEYRYQNPQPHDINNGNCEDWAMKAQELFGGEEVWLDTFKTCADWAHCVLKLNGRYYDSLHPDGAATLRDFKRQAKAYFEQLRFKPESPSESAVCVRGQGKGKNRF